MINTVSSTQTSITIGVIEVPAAVSYLLALTGPDGSQEVVNLFPEDIDVVNGMFKYTFKELEPGTEFTIDAAYMEEGGETIPVGTAVASTISSG